jgi:ribosomal protein S18 acetylase RimI-like enzyme
VIALDIKLPEGVRAADRQDWRLIGGITAEAFSQDPVNLWIFGGTRAMPAVFGALARSVYLPRGTCHLIGDGAAAMWCHSSANRELSLLPMLGLVASVMGTGAKGAVTRALGASAAMAQEHPKAAHLYLFTIGTRKASRGKGLGRRLMAPMLDAADRASLPCYLENSNPTNTGFYKSCGFEHVKLFEPGPDAPPLEAMWREPRLAGIS